MGQKSKKDRKATLVLMMSMLMTVLAIAQTSQTINVR
jgi:hypothetical protein